MSNVAELSSQLNAELAKTDAPTLGTVPACDILLIDVAHLFYAAWHATADREVGEAFSRTLEKVAQVRSRVQHDHCAICCDHGPYWRHEVDPNYKAHRAKPSEVMVEQFARVRDRLAQDGLLVWRIKGYEADDLIGTACRVATERGHRVIIATGDKDLMQCVSDTVSLFNTNSFQEMGVSQVVEKFGVPPRQIPDLLALWGDSSDNIQGIPGVGPKKAAALLSTFGTGVEAVAAARAGDTRIPKAIGEALKEHWQNYGWALPLVTVKSDAPINFDELFQERQPEQLAEENDMAEDFDDDDVVISPPPSAAAQAPAVATQTPAPQTQAQPASITRAEVTETGMALQEQARSALQRAVSFELGLEPTTLGQAVKLAHMLFESRLYTRFPNANAIAAVIIRGREMGLGALTALDCFALVEGKPAMSAHLIVSKALAHPDCEYFTCTETTPETCTYETKHRRSPKVTRHTYTLAQAKQAGICPETLRTVRTGAKDEKDSRGQWEKRPGEMIRKTCAVQLVRIAFPDAALGLLSFEEAGVEV